MSTAKDITGQRFGRLVAKSRAGSHKQASGSSFAMWLCVCDCGVEKIVRGCSLRHGEIVSCGCYNTERTTKMLVGRNTTHGMSKTPEYKAYIGAKKRCTSRKDKGWKNYGGRGIKFLLSSFEEFHRALGPRPSTKHSLDRKDNDKDYSLDNIRWATKEEQMNNRREYATVGRIQCAKCGCREFVRVRGASNVA